MGPRGDGAGRFCRGFGEGGRGREVPECRLVNGPRPIRAPFRRRPTFVPSGRRAALRDWLDNDLLDRFDSCILGVDRDVAATRRGSRPDRRHLEHRRLHAPAQERLQPLDNCAVARSITAAGLCRMPRYVMPIVAPSFVCSTIHTCGVVEPPGRPMIQSARLWATATGPFDSTGSHNKSL